MGFLDATSKKAEGNVTIDIKGPSRPAPSADRSLDCQFALEPAFQDLAERAQTAGWTEDDVATALIELARNHLRGIAADEERMANIEAAARSVL